jgi:plasmid stabilization system protein ParE
MPVKRTRIVLSDAVVADILEQSDWYQEQSGDKLAKRWERAVTSAVLRVVDPASDRLGVCEEC